MYQLKLEKFINKNPKVVFQSLKEGRLFMNCSADSNSIEIDFRVGGKYKLNFRNHGVSNWGEFIEIIPDRKIIFSWCQTFGSEQKPDTKVTIDLFPESQGTKLILMHEGFINKATCDDHYQGWSGGVNDLAFEHDEGKIRLLRRYDVSATDLYKKVLTENLFGPLQVSEEGVSLIGKENLTLSFIQRTEASSALEVIQSHLKTDESIQKMRKHWDRMTNLLLETLK